MAKKILVVEDEKPLADAVTAKLTSARYDVRAAHDGEAALKIAREEMFDLILLDVVLPKVNGFDILDQLRKENIHTPIFMLTNLSQDEEMAKAKSLGANRYIIKSNTPLSDILDYVNELLQAGTKPKA
jgi:DNA-binding response OmpR family regulator